MRSCHNCSNDFEGKFCPNCGQKYYDIPYSFKHVRTLIFDSLDFNRGFFITFYHLLLKPRLVVNTYLSGNSKIYVSPLKYLLLIVAVLALTGGLNEYETYVAALCATLYLWGMNLFLFRKPRYNGIEHLIIVIYEICEFCVLIPPTVLIQFVLTETGIVSVENKDVALMFAFSSLILLYHTYFSMRVFDGKKVLLFMKPFCTIAVTWFIAGLITLLVVRFS